MKTKKTKGKDPGQRFPGLTQAKILGSNAGEKSKGEESKTRGPGQGFPGPTRATIPGTDAGKNWGD